MCAISHAPLQILTTNSKVKFKFLSNFGAIDANVLKM